MGWGGGGNLTWWRERENQEFPTWTIKRDIGQRCQEGRGSPDCLVPLSSPVSI